MIPWRRNVSVVTSLSRQPLDGLCIYCGHPVMETPDQGALLHFIIIDGRKSWSHKCRWSRGRHFCECTDPILEEEEPVAEIVDSPVVFLSPMRPGKFPWSVSLIFSPAAEETIEVKL